MAKVLIVEDNAANMTLATFILESAGHVAIPALNAEAGLAIAREQQPDLILMDIQLPGMDGFEAIALLKRDVVTRDIPVIALTALAMKGDRSGSGPPAATATSPSPFPTRIFSPACRPGWPFRSTPARSRHHDADADSHRADSPHSHRR